MGALQAIENTAEAHPRGCSNHHDYRSIPPINPQEVANGRHVGEERVKTNVEGVIRNRWTEYLHAAIGDLESVMNPGTLVVAEEPLKR